MIKKTVIREAVGKISASLDDLGRFVEFFPQPHEA